jgi:hypothetical protein
VKVKALLLGEQRDPAIRTDACSIRKPRSRGQPPGLFNGAHAPLISASGERDPERAVIA